jgi:predicted metal-dependent phosphoesterase TrpH
VADRIRLDLHNHTHHSSDGTMTPRRLLELAGKRGLDCLAVTDHDTLRGGLECARLAAADVGLPRVIAGQEVTTRSGELVGLYLSEEVPSGLTLLEAVAAIHGQGGLVYLPHPFDHLRRRTVAKSHLLKAAELADIIEVRNGRMLREAFNRRAAELAQRMRKPGGAGSDAHFPGEVGRAYVEVAELPTRDTLLELLAAGATSRTLSPRGRSLAWLYHLRTGTGKLRRTLRARAPRS